MEILKDVLIKEAAGNDKVMIVDNLPKDLLYRKALKLIVDYTNPQQNLVPEFTLNDKNHKVPTGAQVDELLPGIARTEADGAYVFFTDYNEAKERLAAIDRYIELNVPQTERIPERVGYAAQKGLPSSAPIARHLIPRVVLPEFVSPPVLVTAQTPAPRVALKPEAPKNRYIMTEEHKQKMKMGRARAKSTEK